MTEHSRLLRAAFKAELSASRKLSSERGISLDAALRCVLEANAGAQGLAQLLAAREVAHAADAQRKHARAISRTAARTAHLNKHEGATTPWRAWFDGSAHPNPGRCGIGGLLTGPAGERIELSQSAGYGDSSEAEYRALIAVLDAAVRNKVSGLTVYGDSQGVIEDVNGGDAGSAVSLKPYRDQARALMARIDGVTLRWLPRHKNREADALSQRAIAAMAEAS